MDGVSLQIPTLKLLTPSTSKSYSWGMTQATEWNFRSICFIHFICENTHNVRYKNLWNWLCNWNLIFDLLTSPKVTSLILGWNLYLYSITWSCSKKETPLGTPSPPPKSHPWGIPQAKNKNPVWFVWEHKHTNICTKIFQIVLVIVIKW